MVERIYWKKQLPAISQRWRLLCLAGPRQIGKTTFLKDQGIYFSFDDPKLRRDVSQDPVSWLMKEFKKGKRVILDEATRLPEIFEAMKVLSDRFPNDKGRLWFASSSNYRLHSRIRESLAGRAVIYHGSPFLLSELSQNENPPFFRWLLERESCEGIFADEKKIISSALHRSLFPEPYLSNDDIYAGEWLKQYIATYVLQDVVDAYPRTDFVKWQDF
ncbi:MAG: AAA family ATPase, partial [Deltaproteobacteria bacterium]